ncbi:hypothetical protein PT974_06593 [Cladobotryum mycophilum]|uniref:14-3-3 protein n=1 Tax=Cladobotryum mycophilum TaxID=491253 RepID=A0ABR0SN23_9HYPO
MASSEVDQKFLGRIARAVENDNSILSSTLYKLLGLSLRLSDKLVEVKRQRKPDPSFHENVMRILWLAREGLKMLQEYVIPFASSYVELKVLAYKLRASFHHIFVLFRNEPRVSSMATWDPEAAAVAMGEPSKLDKGKGIATDDEPYERPSSVQPTHPLEGGPDAVALADKLLWGSHSLRLSVKTEYAAFLYECVHDTEGSRKMARDTINEVYEATEGMDDDMFRDACELVTVLGKMMRRGLGSSNTLRMQAQTSNPALSTGATPPIGMENPI